MTTHRLGSSLRCRPPEHTLAKATALMAGLGISRVTDITRMDRLGLPVYASIRPRGRALHVHAGKGLVPLDAQVGALMEAVEFAVAEPARSDWTAQPMAVGRFLAQFGGHIDLVDFAPILGRKVTLDDVLVTVACADVRSGEPVQLPAELVFMPFDDPLDLFGWSSNGLASGNSVDEATLHGLLEVVERDTLSMHKARDGSRWVVPASLPPPFDRLVDDWRRLGVDTAVRWLPNPFGVHCFHAVLHEPGRLSVHLAAGYGAHPEPGIALSRALCEAAQSRLSHVHGGRDDVVRFYERYETDALRDEKDAALLPRLFEHSQPLDYRELSGIDTTEPIARQLDRMLDALAAAGFGQVFRHRFAVDLGGLAVVKVVVPGCEDAENCPWRMGRRLFASVTGAAWP